MEQLRNDAQLRKALKSTFSNCRIADEVTVGLCRADVVTIADEIHGYEIKAWNDSLKRLETQCHFYDFAFDRNTLVCTKRHIESAKEIVGEHWGLMCALPDGDGIRFEAMREAQPNPYRVVSYCLDLLWSCERFDLLELHGMLRGCRGNGPKARERILACFDEETIRAYVREAMMGRTEWRNSDGTVIPINDNPPKVTERPKANALVLQF